MKQEVWSGSVRLGEVTNSHRFLEAAFVLFIYLYILKKKKNMRKYEAHLQNIAHISSCKRILFVFFVAGEPRF